MDFKHYVGWLLFLTTTHYMSWTAGVMYGDGSEPNVRRSLFVVALMIGMMTATAQVLAMKTKQLVDTRCAVKEVQDVMQQVKTTLATMQNNVDSDTLRQ